MRSAAFLFAAATAATVALSPAAHAQRASTVNGGVLLQICTSNDPKSIEGCEAYINGVADTASVYQRLRPADGSKGGKLPDYVCIPGPTTGHQLRQSVVEFIRRRGPQVQNRVGGVLVLDALATAYPCQGGKQ